MKRIISILLVISMLLISAVITPVYAISNSDQENDCVGKSKIDKALEEKMLNYFASEKIRVVLWLSDINENEFSTELKKRELEYLENNKINEYEDNLQVQQDLLKIKRDLDKQLTKKNNSLLLDKISNEYDVNIEILYNSIFTPYVDVLMTKEDILKLSKCSYIDTIYLETMSECDNQEQLSINNLSNINTYGYWQEAATIQVMRDVYGFTGSGINIGLIQSGVPDLSESFFDYAVQNNKITNLTSSTSGHATYMASIIVGKSNDYYGVAFNSHLYCSGKINNSYINGIDNLLDNYQINVLDASIYAGVHNTVTYDATSRYFDSIVYGDNVSVCISSGNSSQVTNVCSGAMAYNVITVGNVIDYGTLSTTDDDVAAGSLYVNTSNIAYKPDICAPGACVGTPYWTEVVSTRNGGTSASAAVLSGCCALLMQSSPSLINNPMLLKSSIMASAKHMQNQTPIYSTSTSIDMAINRMYGAGCIDIAESYNIISSNKYMSTTSTNIQDNPYSLTFTATSKNIRKKLYICVNWEQKVINNSSISYTPYYHDLSLYDSLGNRLAYSAYQYDRKQYICIQLTQAGTYQIRVSKYGTSNYNANASIAYDFI